MQEVTVAALKDSSRDSIIAIKFIMGKYQLHTTNNLIVVLLEYKVDPCPDKSWFDFWPSAISVIVDFILTEDEDQSTEYIGVPPPCIYTYNDYYKGCHNFYFDHSRRLPYGKYVCVTFPYY